MKKNTRSSKRVTKKASGRGPGASIALVVRGSARTSLDVIPDADVDRVVKDLRDIVRGATVLYAASVGKLVCERVFKGDVTAMRKKGPKDHSYRKLAMHPDLPMSAVTLWRMVEVSQLLRRHPGLVKMNELTLSHLRAVLGLPDETQDRLLEAAVKEHWTAAHLAERAATHRPASKGGRSRSPIRRFVRGFDKFADIDQVKMHLLAFDGFNEEELGAAEEALARARAALATLEGALRERRGASSVVRANGATHVAIVEA